MKEKRNSAAAAVILGFGVAILVAVCGFLISQTMKNAASSAREAYNETLQDVSEQTQQDYYDWAFQKAEEKYHVSNEVSISIGDINERSRLEVLKVRDVEFIIQEPEESNHNTTIWTAVPGNGIFTVDMAASEFIIDNQRHFVLVKAPVPKLTELKIESDMVENYKFENEMIWNGNYSQGEELAEKHLKEGKNKIRNKIVSSQRYLERAKNSANMIITGLITNLNPDVEDLKIEVEFMDERNV